MRLSVLVTALCISVIGLAVADDVRASIQRPVNIPAEGLGPALQTLAKQRGFQVIYVTEELAGLRTQGVVGELTSEQALRMLLLGTGFTFRYVDDRTVTIVPIVVNSNQSGAQSTSQLSAPAIENTPAWSDNPIRVAQVATQFAPQASAGTDAVPAESPSTELSEIYVTAQKRQERLIDTPLSVSVLSADDLNRMQATQLSDFASTVPGLTLTTSGVGNTQISLRGATSFTPNGTVAIYVDDVPYGSSSAFAAGGTFAFDEALFDVARVEVLRGPQGTLYGASAVGGLLKYVSNAPDSSAFGATLQTGASATDGGGVSYRVSSTVNLPLITGELATRISGFESHEGGYVDNVTLGLKDVDRSNVYGGRLDTLFTPTDALSLRVTGFLQNISRDSNSLVDYGFDGEPLYGSLDQSRKMTEPFFQQFRLGSATLRYDWGPAALTAITSYQSVTTSELVDLTPTFVPLLTLLGEGNYGTAGATLGLSTDKFSQEIRLASNGSPTLEYLIGAFYTHEASSQAQDLLLTSVSGQPVPNDFYELDSPSLYKEWAVFVDLTYHITSQFDISGGIRESHDSQTYTQNTISLPAFGGDSSPTNSEGENVRTYLANARYRLTDNFTAYLRYATGYRPGGPNFFAVDPLTGKVIGDPTFGSDSLKSYEGGFKVQTADRRYNVDFATYYIDWSNIQITTTSDGYSAIANAPNAHIQGLELTAGAHPTNSLSAGLAFAYQHAYLSEASSDLGGAEGERLPDVPRYSGTINADYTFTDSSLRPSVGSMVRYISDRTSSFGPLANGVNYRVPGYATLDLRSSVVLRAIDLQLYAKNVFNKRGGISAGSGGTYEQVSVIQPLTVGVSLSTHF